MKKLLILCTLLLAVLLSGCAAEPLQGQTAGNTSKAPTPQEETPAFFEPVSTDSSSPAKAPTEAADPAACTSNEDKRESGSAISSESVSAPTESNNTESLNSYYDEVEVCQESCSAYFKATITIRNNNMIDSSDLVVAYVERKAVVHIKHWNTQEKGNNQYC